jgi:hypothetical protein
MKSLLACTCIFIYSVSSTFISAQSTDAHILYISEQTGEFTSFDGEASKTTDKHTSGSVILTATGPITYSVTPAAVSINANETKNWTGTIQPDIAAPPPAGTTVEANLSGEWTVTYSRPEGTVSPSDAIGSETNVVPWANLDSVTGDTISMHEMVTREGTEQKDFEVVSIKITVDDTIKCVDGVAILTATTYPTDAYDIEWTTPSGTLSGNSVSYTVPASSGPVSITAKLTIEGVTYSHTGSVEIAKLTSFSLSPCFDTVVSTKFISTVGFDGACKPTVTYTPALLTPPASEQTSVFTATASAGSESFTDSTIGVNSGQLTNIANVTIDFGSIGSMAEDVLDALLNGGVSPCEADGSPIPSGSISWDKFKLCCTDSVVDGEKLSGNISWSYGIGCHFPIFGVPYVATVDAVVSAGLSVDVGASGETTCTDTKICGTFNGSASFGGGVGFTLLSGFVSGDLQLIITGVGIAGSICFTPPPEKKGVVTITFGAGKIVGTIEALWGFISHSVDYPLWSGYTSPEFQFY